MSSIIYASLAVLHFLNSNFTKVHLHSLGVSFAYNDLEPHNDSKSDRPFCEHRASSGLQNKIGFSGKIAQPGQKEVLD